MTKATHAATVATVVVVLGWRADPDGSASDVLRWRVEQGVAQWRRHDHAVLVVTGGAVSNPIPEGPVMAAVARELGVPAEQILIDDKAADTWQNVSAARQLIGAHDVVADGAPIVLVSDPLHARRARRYWTAQYPHEGSRVSVAAVSRPHARWYWPAFSVGYEAVVWVADQVRRR